MLWFGSLVYYSNILTFLDFDKVTVWKVDQHRQDDVTGTL